MRKKHRPKQRFINTRIWDDEYFVNLTPNEKLIFMYLLTNPLTHISGVYHITVRRIAFDTKLDEDLVAQTVQKFHDDTKLKYHEGWIAFKMWLRHQRLNPSMIKGIVDYLEEVPKIIVDWLNENNFLDESLDGNFRPDIPDDISAPVPSSKIPVEKDPVLEKVFKQWNDFAQEHGLEKIADIRGDREMDVRAKLRLKSFNLDKILEAIPGQKFLLGGGKKSWRVSFDYIFSTKEGYIKILEKQFTERTSDGKGEANKTNNGSVTDQGNRAGFKHEDEDRDRFADLEKSLREREEAWSERS